MEVSWQQLYSAAQQCRKGKAKGVQCQQYQARLLDNLFDTQSALQSHTWQPSPMRCFVASNGVKPREIHAPAYQDRVVHHLLVPLIMQLIEHKFIYGCAANIKEWGTHFAVDRLQRMFRQVDQGDKDGWFMQLDIHSFFYSIDLAILLRLLDRHLQRAVKDNRLKQSEAQDLYRLASLVFQPSQVLTRVQDQKILDRLPPHKRLHHCPPGKGLPIGNLTSQFFSNLYLNELDQFIKHQLKCRHYVRYVDDFVLVHQNKDQLEQWRQAIIGFLADKLALRLKPLQTLRPIKDGADFLGYIARPHYLLSRKRVLHSWQQRLHGWQSQYQQGGLFAPGSEALAQLRAWCASYLGHCGHVCLGTMFNTLEQGFPWLKYFLQYHNGQLIALYQPPKVRSFQQQWRWFRQYYADFCLLMQKGRHFVYAFPQQQSQQDMPLSVLKDFRTRLNSKAQPWIWVAEDGYAHARLKQRRLSLLSISDSMIELN
ncbi:RNA-directed DNA polymerase [Marinomonas balearica]|uniref:Retron-type reverse transcriptase n=1 Tax=Marinomonas balearica TaxID=491947 RepID=A0A4R6MGL6_9GAMM|nr:RNA-directed DNA polymerase [Marinomonas balearica]TDO99940.1 retron-type reverse transcriptase [Marinomonas balearica]